MATVLMRCGRVIHSSEADDCEIARIEAGPVRLGYHEGDRDSPKRKKPIKSRDSMASPTGFEPVLPA
jgi:hypothetical protein